ncbi:MAG: murein hydrolase activator EnvC family protein [Acidimicrobiia bacterium]
MARLIASRGVLVLLLVALVAATAATPAFSVTKGQVDAACADSDQALSDYRRAEDRFVEAANAYEETRHELEVVSLREARVRADVERHESTIYDMRDQVEQRAVELYMNGGASNGPGVLFLASSVDELLTGSRFLSAAAQDDLTVIDDLISLRTELGRLRTMLQETQAELREVAAEEESWRSQQEQAMLAAQSSYDKLQGRCRELLDQYEQEQAQARAREAASRQGAAAGISSDATPGFICPFVGSHTSFIDSWGFPRSGGRTHKGVDMFAPYGESMFAVADGVVSTSTSSLGGRSIWLTADYGVAFYYAHLSDWAVSSGQRVSKGQVIGYNGNSGNASGGSAHLHFEIHPGGRGGPAVNPYPTVASACR